MSSAPLGAPRVRTHGGTIAAGASPGCGDEPFPDVQVETGSHEVLARALRHSN